MHSIPVFIAVTDEAKKIGIKTMRWRMTGKNERKWRGRKRYPEEINGPLSLASSRI